MKLVVTDVVFVGDTLIATIKTVVNGVEVGRPYMLEFPGKFEAAA